MCCRVLWNARSNSPASHRLRFAPTKRRFRERTQAGFEEACTAALGYQLDCYASGEPQRVMREFLDRRMAV